jgi:hypothetical protein
MSRFYPRGLTLEGRSSVRQPLLDLLVGLKYDTCSIAVGPLSKDKP